MTYADSQPVLVEASARPTAQIVAETVARIDRSPVLARDVVALALVVLAAALHVMVIVSVTRSAARVVTARRDHRTSSGAANEEPRP